MQGGVPKQGFEDQIRQFSNGSVGSTNSLCAKSPELLEMIGSDLIRDWQQFCELPRKCEEPPFKGGQCPIRYLLIYKMTLTGDYEFGTRGQIDLRGRIVSIVVIDRNYWAFPEWVIVMTNEYGENISSPVYKFNGEPYDIRPVPWHPDQLDNCGDPPSECEPPKPYVPKGRYTNREWWRALAGSLGEGLLGGIGNRIVGRGLGRLLRGVAGGQKTKRNNDRLGDWITIGRGVREGFNRGFGGDRGNRGGKGRGGNTGRGNAPPPNKRPPTRKPTPQPRPTPKPPSSPRTRPRTETKRPRPNGSDQRNKRKTRLPPPKGFGKPKPTSRPDKKPKPTRPYLPQPKPAPRPSPRPPAVVTPKPIPRPPISPGNRPQPRPIGDDPSKGFPTPDRFPNFRPSDYPGSPFLDPGIRPKPAPSPNPNPSTLPGVGRDGTNRNPVGGGTQVRVGERVGSKSKPGTGTDYRYGTEVRIDSSPPKAPPTIPIPIPLTVPPPVPIPPPPMPTPVPPGKCQCPPPEIQIVKVEVPVMIPGAPGKDGRDGKDGRSCDNGEILDAIAGLAESLAALVEGGTEPLPECDLTPVLEAIAEVNKKLPDNALRKRVNQIFDILGGGRWLDRDENIRLDLNPETGLKTLGNTVYSDAQPKEVRLSSFIDLVQAVNTPQYYRSGLHRLPTELPAKIHLKKGEAETKQKIESLLDFQYWQFKQLDSALGMYPIEIKYKDANNKEKVIEVENLAEAVTELVGLSLSLDADTDLLTELAIKTIGEEVQNKAQLSLTVDYLRAISDFLGFKSETGSKKLPIPINPKKNSIKGFLEKSEQDIQSVTLKEPEDNDIISKMNQLLIVTGMLKAALTKRVQTGKLDGDEIRDDLKKGDEEWNEFVNFVNDIPASLKDRGEPKPKVRDKSSLIQD